MPRIECEKHNCNLDKGHDGWHVKKGARGKIIISWLDGEWKGTDGSHGTYRYQEPRSVEDNPVIDQILA